MIPRILLTLFVALSVQPGHAQQRNKLGFQLKAYVENHAQPDEMLDLFVHGDPEAVAEAVRAHGGWVKMHRPGLSSVRVPATNVPDLAAEPAVKAFEFHFGDEAVLNDTMRVKSRVERIQLGEAPLAEAYNGENVIVGLIDTGVDHAHPDFRDENGGTRILRYWDQTLPVNGQTPQPYGYGQVWTREQINAGLMTSVDQPGQNGHGTTVTGVAAGNGLANGTNKGVAPKADIIMVSVSFGGNFRAKVADGVHYIMETAASFGRPAAANISVGSYLGSHDGLDAAALFIDDVLTAQPGRAVACGAGNSNTQPAYHLRTEVGPDTTFTWFTRTSTGLGYQAVYFQLWADTADFNNVHYAVGADRPSPSFQYRGRTPFHTAAQNAAGMITDTLWSFSGHRLGVVDYFLTPRGGQYLLEVHMRQPDSSTYNFRFMTTGSGRFDVWSHSVHGTSNMVLSPLPSAAVQPDIVHYVLPDKNKHIVDSWACSDHVITVANYCNKITYLDYNGNYTNASGGSVNDLAESSSFGPTRDERMKPDIAAPGTICLTPAPLAHIQSLLDNNNGHAVAPGGWHIRNGGTSIASPVVTGTAALYLQQCNNATADQVRAAIIASAFPDEFTGEVPNNRWGHGKLDAFNALVTGMVQGPVNVTAPEGMCEGDAVVVDATDGFAEYTWSNGEEGDPLLYDGEGPLSLIVRNAYGCTASAEDTLYFTHWPLPDQPTVDVAGPVLTSSEAAQYQWYYQGGPLAGANGQVLEATASGDYHVVITDANGCTATSGTVTVLMTGIDGSAPTSVAIWPSPAHDVLHVRVSETEGRTSIAVIDAHGRLVWSGTTAGEVTPVPLTGLAAGTYSLRIDGTEPWSQRFVKLP
jgi:hypothetical protein